MWKVGRKNDYWLHLFSIDGCDLSNWHILLGIWQLFVIRTRSDFAFNMHINCIFAFWDAAGERMYILYSPFFLFWLFFLGRWTRHSAVGVYGIIVLAFQPHKKKKKAVNRCPYICQIPQPVWWINNNGDDDEAVLCLMIMKICHSGAVKHQYPSKPLPKLIQPHFFVRVSGHLDILESFFDHRVYSVL